MPFNPASIPESVFLDVRRWHGQGFGCRRIARMLEGIAVFASKSSVEWCVKSLGCYSS